MWNSPGMRCCVFYKQDSCSHPLSASCCSRSAAADMSGVTLRPVWLNGVLAGSMSPAGFAWTRSSADRNWRRACPPGALPDA